MDKTSREEKLLELKTMIQRYNSKQITFNQMKRFKKETNQHRWFEVEGLSFLLQKDIFDKTQRKVFRLFIGESSLSSPKVWNEFLSLFGTIQDSIGNQFSLIESSHENEKHNKMCWLLRRMIEFKEVDDEIKNKIFEYFVKIIELTEEEDNIWLAVNAFARFNSSRVQQWLKERLNLLVKQVKSKGFGEIELRKHRRICTLLKIMLTRLVRMINLRHYSQNREFYLNVLNQLKDPVFGYMTGLLKYSILKRGAQFNEVTTLAVINLEMMVLAGQLNEDQKKILKFNLKKLNKPSQSIPKNCNFNPYQYQMSLCAGGCLENVFEENGKVGVLPMIILSPDRLVARNDKGYYPSVRSAFAVTSGTYFYEVILMTKGVVQIGWSTREAKLNDANGIGDNAHSISFDPFRGCIWHKTNSKNKHPISNMPSWKPGAVVGCLLDAPNKKFVFYLNGKEIEYSGRTHFSYLPYYASTTLDVNQQCHYNFDKTTFRYPPNIVEFKNFHDESGGNAEKYQLVDTATIFETYWFMHKVVDKVDLYYRDKKQFKYDKLVFQIEENIKNIKTTEQVNLKKIVQFSSKSFKASNENSRRFIQSVIEVMQTELPHETFIRDILAKYAELYKNEKKLTVFLAQLFELIYPYTQLQVNHENSEKLYKVCVIVVTILSIFPKLPNVAYKISIQFLLANKFVSIKTFKKSPLMIMNAISGLAKCKFSQEFKQMLKDDKIFVKTLKKCIKIVKQHYDPRLCMITRDFTTLQTCLYAKWFWEQLLDNCEDEKDLPSSGNFQYSRVDNSIIIIGSNVEVENMLLVKRTIRNKFTSISPIHAECSKCPESEHSKTSSYSGANDPIQKCHFCRNQTFQKIVNFHSICICLDCIKQLNRTKSAKKKKTKLAYESNSDNISNEYEASTKQSPRFSAPIGSKWKVTINSKVA